MSPPPADPPLTGRPESAAGRPPGSRGSPAAPVRQRGWFEVRWRQFRNAPRPVFRAVMSSLAVAGVLGVAYLVYDIALTHGARLPGGDLRVLFVTIDVVVVLVFGTLITWLIVPAPRSTRERATRTPWSAALGFFAAVPVAYLVLVVVVQVLKPLFV